MPADRAEEHLPFVDLSQSSDRRFSSEELVFSLTDACVDPRDCPIATSSVGEMLYAQNHTTATKRREEQCAYQILAYCQNIAS